MSAILTPVGLLLIILAGYLFKRFGLFGQKDYRVLQTAEFNIVLPGAIVYSFATNPHDISLLLISVFAFLFAFIPVVFIFLATRKRNVTDRAFLMLNGAGFNLGCFSFPVVQSFWGAGAVVPAAMFDIGNCVMVAAGTNVLTQQLLHIQPGKTLAEQHAGSAPTLPYEKPKDRDAKRLARRALLRTIGKSFFGSVPFDTYLLMIVLTVANVKISDWIASITQPLSGANALVSMLMVGMLMDLPQSKHGRHRLAYTVQRRLRVDRVVPAAVLGFDSRRDGDLRVGSDRHFLHAVHRQSTRQRQTGRLLAGNHRDDFTGDDGCGSRADGRVSKCASRHTAGARSNETQPT
mgnify:CR=1 FL=1